MKPKSTLFGFPIIESDEKVSGEIKFGDFSEYIRKETVQDMEELLDFIKGVGKFKGFGNGIHTYPGRDPNNQKIYDACLELERRGLIERRIDDPAHVVWVAKEGI